MSSFRDENVRYLRPVWIRAGVVYVAVTGVIVYLCASLPSNIAALSPLGVGAGVGVAVGVAVSIFKRRTRRRHAHQALQLASADATARLLFGDYLNQPGRVLVPLVITGAAQIHVVYGNFARAEEMLTAHDWQSEPPLIRGDRHYVLALMEHVKGNHQAAFAHVATMLPMMDLPKVFPGSARLRRSLAFLDYLGRALAHGDAHAIAGLADRKLTKSSRLQRGVAAWALASVEEQRGHHEEARRWLAESRAILPHAYGLGVERPINLAPPMKHDAANPYAAPTAAAIDASPFEARQGRPTFWRRHRLKIVGVWMVVLLGAHTYLSCINR